MNRNGLRAKICILCCAVLWLMLCAVTAAFGASKSEMKRMSVFLSNFTECGLMNFDIKQGDEDDEETIHFGSNNAGLLAFGIRHNAINNRKLIKKTKLTVNNIVYDRSVSSKAVAASVRRYFDLPVNNEDAIDQYGQESPYRKGMYYFRAASGEEVLYADVQEVSQEGRVIIMTGEIYNADDETDRRGTFVATAKPHKWKGKNTWAVLSMQTELD